MAQRFLELLEDLKSRLARMAAMVQLAVEQSVEAVLTLDPKLARSVIDSDQRVDDDEVRIERKAIDLLALHSPAASDLRLITGILKANNDYERMADCAVNIAQRVGPLSQMGKFDLPPDLRLLASSVLSGLRDTIKAFNLADENLARQVVRNDDVVDAVYHQIVQDMVLTMERNQHKVDIDLSIIMISKNLERIADHCVNVAEDVIYVRSGQIIRHDHPK
jgi:phosphate transport system protein